MDDESSLHRNSAALLCPACSTAVLGVGAARWAPCDPPEEIPVAEVGGCKDGVSEIMRAGWTVQDSAAFMNMSLTTKVPSGLQYIACGACEFGPLGFRRADNAFVLCPSRVVIESFDQQARLAPTLKGQAAQQVRAMILEAEAERYDTCHTYNVEFDDNCSMRLGEIEDYEGATVVIGFLSDDSPAKQKGVQLGDIVLRVGGRNVSSVGWEVVVETINSSARPLEVTFYRA